MNLKNWFLNTFIRYEPAIRHYTEADISRIQNDLIKMKSAHERLVQCGEDVLTECRNENQSVSSEIHIKDLVAFKASYAEYQASGSETH